MTKVVVIGWDKDDDLYVASSSSDLKKVNWLLDCVKRKMFAE